MKILQNIKFLARQGLALRGRDDDCNSNFMQLYHLRAIGNPELQIWLQKRAPYKSVTIQNEILQTMALQVLEDVASSLQSSDFFSVLADETADASNKEQLVVCIRWVDDHFQAHEEFIGLHHLHECNATAIVDSIKSAIREMGLDTEKLRGQCYDGCSTMAGTKGGVATLMKLVEKRALYTHCYGHATNLACSDSIRQVKCVRGAHDTVNEISKLVRKSPKRDSHLEKMKSEMSNDEQEKNAPRVLSFCPTRWTVRGKTLDSILKNYSSLQNLWEWALENCTDTDMKARIRGVDKHMEEFDFYFWVALGELLLRHSDKLSATLQEEEFSAAGVQNIFQMTLTALMSFRSDDSFLLFWDKVLMLSRQVGVNEPSLPRQKKAPSRFESSSDSHYFPTNVKEHLKKIYFEAIDTLTACLKDRFDQSDFNMYAKLEQVLLKSAKSECCEEEIEECCRFYGSDLDDNTLKTQLQKFSGICKTNQLDTGCLLSDIINLFKTLIVEERIAQRCAWRERLYFFFAACR